MANTWTTIPSGDVDVDSPVTTALMTALRDNPEGIAQRASGAPKIFGCPYDFQEFTASGTWTKPSNAESGDRVIVQVVGGGGSGSAASTGNISGGGGGAGCMFIFDDIDDLNGTETVVVGAGGASVTAGTGTGNAGGASTFGTAINPQYLEAGGGGAGLNGTNSTGGVFLYFATNGGTSVAFDGGISVAGNSAATGTPFGAGAGSGINATSGVGGQRPSASSFAGSGGRGGTGGSTGTAGAFPGGGGGAADNAASGAGAAGVVRVWCIREEA